MNGHTHNGQGGLQDELHVGLKEWAVVCSALGQGGQVLLLRKGGIHESGGEFELEHPQFLLFPTHLHQDPRMLKPQQHGNLAALQAEPEQIELRTAGVVTDIVQVASREQIDALEAEHIWSAALIDMRFNYKPQNPLYLLLVRAYALAEPAWVRNTPEYAGCRSWVPLRQSVCTRGARPVLGPEAYEGRRSEILRKVAAARG